ncbi:SUMF1/EgtB/PvdO family nonheme iron enzyme, partial [Chloroflexota bacterium]
WVEEKPEPVIKEERPSFTGEPVGQRSHDERKVKERTPSWLPWVIGIGGVGLIAFLVISVILITVMLKPEITPTLTNVQSGPLIGTFTQTYEMLPTQKNISTSTRLPQIIFSLTPTMESFGLDNTWTSPKDEMLMVFVPAGDFSMGSNSGEPDERPVHIVYLDAFWIDQTEVTRRMFALFVDDTGYISEAEKRGWSYTYPPGSNSERKETNNMTWRNSVGTTSSDVDEPVIHVTWNDAQEYCSWAGKRLPTEAEWEKAARGVDSLQFPWGNSFNCHSGNFDSETVVDDSLIQGGSNCDPFPYLAPVGSFPSGSSYYGVMDMAGNVWEFVADWYSQDYYSISPKNNPSGPISGKYRVLRGASWNSDILKGIRSTWRDYALQEYSIDNVGFRCVMDD